MIKIANLGFEKPFKSNIQAGIYKKRTFAKQRGKYGVYLIKENGKIVYVGMSQSCVVEAMYRHFYHWNTTRNFQYRVTYFDRMSLHNYTVQIMFTNKDEAPKLEQSLILLMQPRDNRERYEELIPLLIQKISDKQINNSGWQEATSGTPF